MGTAINGHLSDSSPLQSLAIPAVRPCCPHPPFLLFLGARISAVLLTASEQHSTCPSSEPCPKKLACLEHLSRGPTLTRPHTMGCNGLPRLQHDVSSCRVHGRQRLGQPTTNDGGGDDPWGKANGPKGHFSHGEIHLRMHLSGQQRHPNPLSSKAPC